MAGLLLTTLSSQARVIPDPAQTPAPGNYQPKPTLRQVNYSPAVNYQLQCLGCHLAHGEGAPASDIPRMQGFVGHYLKVNGGRAYLVQVPGVSQSALSDRQLAELLNWIMRKDGIAGVSTPLQFVPYTEQEVAKYRHRSLNDLAGYRTQLLEQIRHLGISIPKQVIP